MTNSNTDSGTKHGIHIPHKTEMSSVAGCPCPDGSCICETQKSTSTTSNVLKIHTDPYLGKPTSEKRMPLTLS